MTGGTLIIAPHCDDAAFSMGGILLIRYLPQPTKVATVFTQSNYTLARRMDNRASEVTAMRKNEERTFLASAQTPWLDLDFAEATLRGYTSLREIFTADASQDPIRESIKARLYDIVTSTSPDLIGLPLGLGSHVDHIIVRDSAMALLSGLLIPCFWYEELPYATQLSEEEIAGVAHICNQENVSHMINISDVLNDKLDGLRTYSSQVGPDETSSVRSHAHRIGGQVVGAGERIWATPSVWQELTRFIAKFNTWRGTANE